MVDSPLLSADDLQSMEDVQFKEVNVPEWKRTVRLGSLTAQDMIEWVESNEGPAKRTASLRLLVKSLVDAEGKRIGNDKLLESLKRRNADVIRRLVEEILKLNGLSVKPETVKNGSGGAPADASPSASPVSSAT